MKVARGPRPWSIWSFAVILTLYGLFNLVSGLTYLSEQEQLLRNQFPRIGWNADWVIVWVSAQFTIVLIPIIAIWVFASRFARIIVTVMALVSLPWLASYARTYSLYGVVDWIGLMQASLVVMPAGLLFLPSASKWLRQEAVDDTAIFD